MLLKMYVDDPRMLKLCKSVVEDCGGTSLELHRGEECRSDITMLLFSFFGDSLDDFVESHPYNRIIIVGPTGICRRNVRYFRDIEELIPFLTVLCHREPKVAMPLVSGSKQQHARRKKIARVKCPFCNKDIGAVALGLEKHLVACREYANRPAAFGVMFMERQPNGRSKGSHLVVYIPSPVNVNNVHLRTGVHMICNGPLIKILNAVLRDTFRYTLDKEERS